MNKGAAKALVSRLKLYLASPLYNPNNDLNKWQEAVDAAKAVIDLNVYDLHYTAEKQRMLRQILLRDFWLFLETMLHLRLSTKKRL